VDGQEEYPEVYTPSPDELKARNRRNLAIAALLAAFMIFVFMSIIMRGQGGGA